MLTCCRLAALALLTVAALPAAAQTPTDDRRERPDGREPSFPRAETSALVTTDPLAREIPYQGVLTDAGAPVAVATAVVFQLYDAASGGTLVWTENRTVTPDAAGRFDVRLGAVTALPNDMGQPLWLAVSVGGTALGPRTALGAAPYALALYGFSVLPSTFVGETYAPNLVGGAPENVVGPGIGGATISGGGLAGFTNSVTAVYGTVGGGAGNSVTAFVGTIGGGSGNVAGGAFATVGGGDANQATGSYSTAGGGQTNKASADHATIGGGAYNQATANAATVAGGDSNEATGINATVGGGSSNQATGVEATVGGGSVNEATADYSTAGGGRFNDATAAYATVGGGNSNVASGEYSTVPGGRLNQATGTSSFAAGHVARALHPGAFVWSDQTTSAAFASTGDNQFLIGAAGGVGIGTNAPEAHLHIDYNSDATRPHLLLDEPGGTDFARLVFRNGNSAGHTWTIAGGGGFGAQFSISTRGRNVFNVFPDADDGGPPNLIGTSAGGAGLTQGGVWTNASSRALKTDFRPVDGAAVLDALATVPVTTWRYHAEADGVRHMGPVSQDFHAAFGLGASAETIGTVDADGVALASVQALYALVQAQDGEIAALRTDRDRQQAEIEALRADLVALIRHLGASAEAVSAATVR